MRRLRGPVLPGRHGRRQWGRAMREAPGQADQYQQEYRDADPLVIRIELELERRKRQFVHVHTEQGGA